MVSLAMSCVKYLVFFFNLIFAICGIAILVIGSLFQGAFHTYSTFINDNFAFIPIVVIIIGLVMFVIAFFGFCGTVKESKCMISAFAALLIIIFIMEIVVAIGAYIFHNDLKTIIIQQMDSSLDHYNKDADIKKSWDILQSDLQCCGVNGTADWKESIPSSCCSISGSEEPCPDANIFQEGCYEKIVNLIEQNILILGVVAVVVALMQVIGIAFACCLVYSLRKGYENV